MALNTGFLLFALAIGQVLTEYAEVDFIENVSKRADGSRIVSGWDARPGQHPHQVNLRMVNPLGEVSGCGGCLIHERWVLTAAHCTAGRITLVVRAGVTNLTTPDYISETTVWFNHPTYNDLLPAVVQPNDISVVQLQHPVKFNGITNRIRLQSGADAYRDYDGQVVYASGYGRVWTGGATPEVLQWVYLTAVSNTNCFQTFGSIVTSTTICARFYNVTSQSICQGDSGGPLVHVGADGVPTLIGVSSFVAGGDFGCHSGLPGAFIRPGPFLGWLEEVTRIDFEDLDEEEETPPDSNEENSNESSSEEEEQPPTEKPTPKPDSEEENSNESSSKEEEQPPTEKPAPKPDSEEENSNESNESSSEEDSTLPPTEKPKPPKPDSTEEEDDSKENSSESNGSSSEEDPELTDLLKRLEVKVKVKVQMNKFKKKHSIHEVHEKRRRHGGGGH